MPWPREWHLPPQHPPGERCRAPEANPSAAASDAVAAQMRLKPYGAAVTVLPREHLDFEPEGRGRGAGKPRRHAGIFKLLACPRELV